MAGPYEKQNGGLGATDRKETSLGNAGGCSCWIGHSAPFPPSANPAPFFLLRSPPLVLDQGPSKAWRKHISWTEGWVGENQCPQVLQPHLLFSLSGSCHFCQGPSAGWDVNSGSSLRVFSTVTFLQGHASVFTFLIPKRIAASHPSRRAPVLKLGVQRWL